MKLYARCMSGLGLSAVLTVFAAGALAQQGHDHDAGANQPGNRMQQDDGGPGGMEHGQGGGGMSGMGGMQQRMQQMHESWHATGDGTGLTVFGAIQQRVRQLQADPETDWTEVDIPALRQHLVDMEHLSLFADVEMLGTDEGAQFIVTGSGRTLQAIQRMVPMHARQLQEEMAWQADTELLANGVRFTVNSDVSNEQAMIRGLGFFGVMTLGEHHASHHQQMAGSAQSDQHAMDHGQGGGDHTGHTGH